MNVLTLPVIRVVDFKPRRDTFREDFREGLRRDPKQIPPKYFYDAEGSRLFDRICELEEYFPTRTENDLLYRHSEEVCALVGSGCRLVEYGSGSSDKTRLLLDRLETPAAYVPIEISREHLLKATGTLARRYPEVEMLPVCADYTEPYQAPTPARRYRKTLFFFPGSTIGNFLPEEALGFLKGVGQQAVPGDGLLIGIGLQTDQAVLERAYNDAAGVTAAFNRNLLERARRELGVAINPASFRHEAVYDRTYHRIEMRLVCQHKQAFELDGELFKIRPGEHIVTEYSHKFTDAGFVRMAAQAGFHAERAWTDPSERFSIHYLERTPDSLHATHWDAGPVGKVGRRMRRVQR